jgi:hypothetical protein
MTPAITGATSQTGTIWIVLAIAAGLIGAGLQLTPATAVAVAVAAGEFPTIVQLVPFAVGTLLTVAASVGLAAGHRRREVAVAGALFGVLLLAEAAVTVPAYAFWPRAASATGPQIAMFAWIVLPGVLGGAGAIVAAVTRRRALRILGVITVWLLGVGSMIALSATRLNG